MKFSPSKSQYKLEHPSQPIIPKSKKGRLILEDLIPPLDIHLTLSERERLCKRDKFNYNKNASHPSAQ